MASLVQLSPSCNNNFHKKCTNLKSKSGNWKPSRWFCSTCTNEFAEDVSPEKEIDNYTIQNPSARHRKANFAACNHSDREFLESQINTLKSIVAKREADLKTLKDSDNLKAKRIMQLESQLKEARDAICRKKSIEEDVNKESIDNVLEKRTKILEVQMNEVLSKISLFERSLYKDPTTSSKILVCEICDETFDEKSKLKNHKKEVHFIDLVCKYCGFLSNDNAAIEEHMSTHLIKCKDCRYSTYTDLDMRAHSIIHQYKCQECSYHAIGSRDLNRHRHTMHPRCDACDFIGRNEADMLKHMNTIHRELMTICNICSYTCRTQDDLKKHLEYKHIDTFRTRVFSSRRQSTSNCMSNQIQTPSVFRPWSQNIDRQEESTPAPHPFPNSSVPPPFGDRHHRD